MEARRGRVVARYAATAGAFAVLAYGRWPRVQPLPPVGGRRGWRIAAARSEVALCLAVRNGAQAVWSGPWVGCGHMVGMGRAAGIVTPLGHGLAVYLAATVLAEQLGAAEALVPAADMPCGRLAALVLARSTTSLALEGRDRARLEALAATILRREGVSPRIVLLGSSADHVLTAASPTGRRLSLPGCGVEGPWLTLVDGPDLGLDDLAPGRYRAGPAEAMGGGAPGPEFDLARVEALAARLAALGFRVELQTIDSAQGTKVKSVDALIGKGATARWRTTIPRSS